MLCFEPRTSFAKEVRGSKILSLSARVLGGVRLGEFYMVGGKIQNVLLLQNSSDASSDAIGNEIIAGPIEATP